MSYKATMSSTSTVGTTSPNRNIAHLTYSCDPNNPSRTTSTTDDKADAYTYALRLVKSGSDATALSGASFTVRDSTTGAYRTTDGGWTAEDGRDTTFTTGDDGTFETSGIDAGHYDITETSAPSGYERLTEPIHVDISSNVTSADTLSLSASCSGDGSTISGVDTSAGVVSVSATDQKSGTRLSSGDIIKTGDNAVWFLAGAIVVCGSVAIIVTRRKSR